MSSRQDICTALLSHKFIAIIRCTDQEHVAPIISNLITAGVQCLEITSNTPGWQHEISTARRLYPHILIGAGTIKTPALAEQAATAGAQFMVTPNTNEQVVLRAHAHNTPVLMGALTPTEVADALEYGADIIKLFPAETMGIDYLKGLFGPYHNSSIMAVDNMQPERMREWLDAGAAGVAVGNILAYPTADSAAAKQQRELAKHYLKLIN